MLQIKMMLIHPQHKHMRNDSLGKPRVFHQREKRKSPDKLNLITITEKTDGHFSESVLNAWWNWENVNQRVTYALLTELIMMSPKKSRKHGLERTVNTGSKQPIVNMNHC